MVSWIWFVPLVSCCIWLLERGNRWKTSADLARYETELRDLWVRQLQREQEAWRLRFARAVRFGKAMRQKARASSANRSPTRSHADPENSKGPAT